MKHHCRLAAFQDCHVKRQTIAARRRHQDVSQDYVGTLGGEQGQCIIATTDLNGTMAMLPQHPAKETAACTVGVHNQDGGH